MGNNFPVNKYSEEVEVAINKTASSAGNPGGIAVAGVISPSEISGTEATFQISVDGVNFYEVIDPELGTAYTVKIAATKYTPLKFEYFWYAAFIKIICVTEQEAARTFKFVYAN